LKCLSRLDIVLEDISILTVPFLFFGFTSSFFFKESLFLNLLIKLLWLEVTIHQPIDLDPFAPSSSTLKNILIIAGANIS